MEIKIRHFLDPKCQFFLYEKEPYLYVSYQFDYGLMGGSGFMELPGKIF